MTRLEGFLACFKKACKKKESITGSEEKTSKNFIGPTVGKCA